jgi:TRAP-type mannitol/chloroaromatic compound transport system permease small subunit
MRKASQLIDRINLRVGQAVAWLVLLVVLVQFVAVLLRYIFGVNFIEAQEMITIMHGLAFMLAAAWVLQNDKHVRVDIFYHDASPSNKAMINLAGSLLFLLPAMALIWFYAWPYVGESWRVFEGAPEAGFIRLRFLQKTAILAFALMMMMQGVSIILRSLLALNRRRS